MRKPLSLFPALTLSLACSSISIAQQPGQDVGAERIAASEVGSEHVRFDTSCHADVADVFNRGVALMHSFWFAEAIATFDQILMSDSDCKIAYWGIALSHWGNPFAGQRNSQQLQRGQEVLARANRIEAGSEREQAYIDAVALLFSDMEPDSQRDRTLAYEVAMNQIVEAYPQDIEAKIFYALAINQNATPNDQSYNNQLKAAGILEPLFEANSDHPGLAHYIIHAYDHPPLAERALDAAQRYAALAPDAPHALHMPSHTFTRVGMWQESVDTNLRSAQAARNNNDAGSELHALDYQTYAYLQMAQDDAAVRVLERARELMGQVDITAVGATQAGAFAIAAIPARYAMERNDWEQASQLAVVPANTPHTQAMTHFARAIGAARRGNPEAGSDDVAMLETLHQRALERRDAYWAEQIEIQVQAARAWLAFVSGDTVTGMQLMAAAAEIEDATDKSAVTPGPLVPAREMLGDMLLSLDDPAQALLEYESTLQKEPNRFRAIYGAGLSAERLGDNDKARQYFASLLEIAGASSAARPELHYARDFLANNQVSQ